MWEGKPKRIIPKEKPTLSGRDWKTKSIQCPWRNSNRGPRGGTPGQKSMVSLVIAAAEFTWVKHDLHLPIETYQTGKAKRLEKRPVGHCHMVGIILNFKFLQTSLLVKLCINNFLLFCSLFGLYPSSVSSIPFEKPVRLNLFWSKLDIKSRICIWSFDHCL